LPEGWLQSVLRAELRILMSYRPVYGWIVEFRDGGRLLKFAGKKNNGIDCRSGFLPKPGEA